MVTLAILGCISSTVLGVLYLLSLRRARTYRLLAQNLGHDKHQISVGVVRAVRSLRLLIEKWDKFGNRDLIRDRILHALVALEEIMPEFKKTRKNKGA